MSAASPANTNNPMLHERNEPLELEGAAALPGERVQSHLTVGESHDGEAARVPFVLIRGRKPGKVVYIQAVSDGDELNGAAVVHRLLRRINPEQLCGGLILVPVANIQAFRARTAYNPVDGRKLNRCFPGCPDGSASERLAHALFQAVLKADICIDLHQGGVRPMIDEVRVRTAPDHSAHSACLELALLFGVGYILDEQGPAGQLAQEAPDRGIPTIDPELGGCHGFDENSVQKGMRGVMNILRRHGLMEGEPNVPARQTLVRGFVTVRCNRGGFADLHAQLYDRVEAGQTIATMRNLFDEPLETIAAPVSGVVWAKPLYPSASAGEWILTIGADPETVEWPPQNADG